MKQVIGSLLCIPRRTLVLKKHLLSAQLRKTDMLRKGQEGHVRAERDVRAVALRHSEV